METLDYAGGAKPLRTEVIVRAKFKAKGLLLANKESIKQLQPIEKVIVARGRLVDEDLQVGASIITRSNEMTIQALPAFGNLSVEHVINTLGKIDNINVDNKTFLKNVNTTKSKYDLSAEYVMYAYYILNESDIRVIKCEGVLDIPQEELDQFEINLIDKSAIN